MVVLEPPKETSVLADNLNLVAFRNVCSKYSLDKDLIVEFEMDPQLKGSSWDWIAIFKEGWNTYESYLVFEWGIGRPCGGRRRKVKFSGKYLTKHVSVNTNYQFVYISRYLEIFGESEYFQFELPFIQRVDRICDMPILCGQGKELLDGDVNNCLLKKYPCVKNVITSCVHCRNVPESKSEVDSKKFEEYDAKYSELWKKVENLECVVDTLLYQLKMEDDIYDMGITECCKSGGNLNHSVRDYRVDGSSVKRVSSGTLDTGLLDYRSQLAIVESEASLVLKAIIGRQEQKIRELTDLIYKKMDSGNETINARESQPRPSHPVNPCVYQVNPVEQHIVKITRTQEKMLAEIFNLNQSCEEYSNEAELHEKLAQKHRETDDQ